MKKISELRELSIKELEEELLESRKKQLQSWIKKENEAVSRTHVVKQLRRYIARIKTLVTEKVG